MNHLNTQASVDSIDGIISAINNGIKTDPYITATIKGLEEALTDIDEMKKREADAKESEEDNIIKREKFEFDSAELEASLDWITENFEMLHEMQNSGAAIERKKVPTFLNALSYISDSLINLGINDPGLITGDVDIPMAADYFKKISLNESFAATFLECRSMTIVMSPLFDSDADKSLLEIAQPMLQVKKGENSFLLALAPCSIYFPDWYYFVESLRKSIMANLEDALIEYEASRLGKAPELEIIGDDELEDAEIEKQ